MTPTGFADYSGGAVARSRGTIYAVQAWNNLFPLNLSLTVIAGKAWRILSLYGELTTNGNAGSRLPYLLCTLATVPVFKAFANLTTGPSTTGFYSWYPGAVYYPAASAIVATPLPIDLVLPAGAVLSTVTLNEDAGDTWSNAYALVEEWPYP